MEEFKVLLCDRGGQVTGTVDHVLAGTEIEVVKTPPQCPRANAYAERWIRITPGANAPPVPGVTISRSRDEPPAGSTPTSKGKPYPFAAGQPTLKLTRSRPPALGPATANPLA
ncbi:MAG TPA: hypothetical protein VG296_17310 [Actinospica sp.]|nr:hypothetical protein [Actinospica sp.]HWG25873.1 hypothetical protein [Actinospica sp.]